MRAEGVASRISRKKPSLARQLERAADSVPAAIAEGRGRATDADFAHYISIAIGSVTEVESHLQRGYDGGLIPESEWKELTDSAVEVRRMLYGLRKRLRGEGEPPAVPKPALEASAEVAGLGSGSTLT